MAKFAVQGKSAELISSSTGMKPGITVSLMSGVIAGVVAAIMALGRALVAGDESSVYEKRGPLYL